MTKYQLGAKYLVPLQGNHEGRLGVFECVALSQWEDGFQSVILELYPIRITEELKAGQECPYEEVKE